MQLLYDSLELKSQSLENLGVVRDKYTAMLYPLVELSVLDDIFRTRKRNRSSHRRSPDIFNDMESELNETPHTYIKIAVESSSKN